MQKIIEYVVICVSILILVKLKANHNKDYSIVKTSEAAKVAFFCGRKLWLNRRSRIGCFNGFFHWSFENSLTLFLLIKKQLIILLLRHLIKPLFNKIPTPVDINMKVLVQF